MEAYLLRFTAVFTLLLGFFSWGFFLQSTSHSVDHASSRNPNSIACKPLNPRPQNPMLLIAHRGDEQKFVENTHEALVSGVRSGVDYVETDIRKSSDGIFLIHHDDKTGRVTTCPEGEATIASAKWEYLRNNCFYKNVSEESKKINTMAELLELARFEKAGLVLDVKPEVKASDMKDFADELLQLDPEGKCLKGEAIDGTFACYRRIIVYINDHEAQTELHNLVTGHQNTDPKYRILSNMIFLRIMGDPADALKHPEKYLDHDGLAFNLGATSCETLQALREIPGKMMVGWTLQTKEELESAQSMGLDAVVTSRLHDYLEYLKK